MFGHQQDDHDNQPTENLIPEPTVDGVLTDGEEHTDAIVGSDQPADDAFNPALPPSDNQPGSVTAPTDDDSVSSAPVFDASDDDTPAAVTLPTPTDDGPTPGDSDTNHLLDIKQQALTQLTPLVDHLDQSPEEKFRTTMMMIQASDNQALVATAYEAAQAITDEKVKAQALLDIVNEINYFTHQNSNS